MQVLAQAGQSNYDVLLQTYGNPDYFIKLLLDNGLNYSTQTSNSYTFDNTQKNINSNFIGVNYATNTNLPSSYFIPESGDGYFEDEDGKIFIPE